MSTQGNDDGFVACLGCGELVAAAVNRVYPVGCEDLICMECAVQRGGQYDEGEDRWKVPPRIDDLLETVEAHAH